MPKGTRLPLSLDFQRRGDNGWIVDFTCRAKSTVLRGGEVILADRLVGKVTAVIRVRSFAKSRDVEPKDWRIKNSQTGQTYDIKSIVPSEDLRWIDFTCQTEQV